MMLTLSFKHSCKLNGATSILFIFMCEFQIILSFPLYWFTKCFTLKISRWETSLNIFKDDHGLQIINVIILCTIFFLNIPKNYHFYFGVLNILLIEEINVYNIYAIDSLLQDLPFLIS